MFASLPIPNIEYVDIYFELGAGGAFDLIMRVYVIPNPGDEPALVREVIYILGSSDFRVFWKSALPCCPGRRY